MSRASGLISRIFKGLTASLPKNTRMVGQDHLGNRYFEKDPSESNRRGSRWVEAPGQEADPTFIPDVPAEWDSWLRRRRDAPPSQEEIDYNYAMMVRTQQRAKELQKTGGKASQESTAEDAHEVPYTETVTQDSFKSKFPSYKDLEITPGQFKNKGQKDK